MTASPDEDRRPLVPWAGLVLILGPLMAAVAATAGGASPAVLLPGLLVSLVLAMAWVRARGVSWGSLGLAARHFSGKTLLLAFLATLGLLLLQIVVGLLMDAANMRVETGSLDALEDDVSVLIGFLVVVWTTAAFGEELLFRGFLLNALGDLMSPRRADGSRDESWPLIISSVLFGCCHPFYGLAGVILTGLVGLVIGWAYLVFGRNLWLAILTHGLFDTVAVLAYFASGS